MTSSTLVKHPILRACLKSAMLASIRLSVSVADMVARIWAMNVDRGGTKKSKDGLLLMMTTFVKDHCSHLYRNQSNMQGWVTSIIVVPH